MQIECEFSVRPPLTHAYDRQHDTQRRHVPLHDVSFTIFLRWIDSLSSVLPCSPIVAQVWPFSTTVDPSFIRYLSTTSFSLYGDSAIDLFKKINSRML